MTLELKILRTVGKDVRKVSSSLLVLRLLFCQEACESDDISIDLLLYNRLHLAVQLRHAGVSFGGILIYPDRRSMLLEALGRWSGRIGLLRNVRISLRRSFANV